MQQLTNEELNELAIRVSARMNGTQISRVIPKIVQDKLKELTQGYPYRNQFVMPIGSGDIMFDVTIQSDGSIKMELSDLTHYRFWEAHLEAPKD